MIPFKIVVIVILHHTPKSPKAVELRIRAIGIRSKFKSPVTKEGIKVLPKPLKAPDEPISTAKKNCDTPSIFK